MMVKRWSLMSEEKFFTIFRLNPQPMIICRLSDNVIIEANEAGQKALQFYIDGLYKHKYCAIDMKHDAEAFGLGVASMFCRESWVVDYLAKNAPNLKYGVALQPRGAKGWCTLAATRGFAVPKVSKNQEELRTKARALHTKSKIMEDNHQNPI